MCLQLQAGPAAHDRHIGPYREFPHVHTEQNEWIDECSLEQNGLSI